MAKKKKIVTSIFLILSMLLTSCSTKKEATKFGNFYEIYVGSFYDSNNDGIGDINGIINKLDYINDNKESSDTSLHVDGLWLMPIMPSPTYHKYDVINYYEIDKDYGTLEDFKKLLEESKKRNVKIIIDLVMNHTSTENEWFLKAIEELKTKSEPHYQNYYNFTTEKISSSYYPTGVDGYFYEANFSSNMPDLNWDNENVKTEFEKIVKYWIDIGVDGFRLDAVKYLFTENQKSIAVCKWLSDYCKELNPNIYLVGEVWSNDKDTLEFYSSGFDSFFNFALAQQGGSIANAINNSSGADFTTNILRWNKLIKSKNSKSFDAVFLSNHDTNRSSGYFENDLDKMKMAFLLYLFVPGNTFIYYGEEIGLSGKGKDENKRGPMVWSNTNLAGIPRPPKNYDQKTFQVNGVDEQLKDKNSLLNFYINAIKIKNKHKEIFDGEVVQLKNPDREIASFEINSLSKNLIIIHNLGNESKEVDLKKYSLQNNFSFVSVFNENPNLNKNILTIPKYTTAILEYTK